jgi:hypothetical protein
LVCPYADGAALVVGKLDAVPEGPAGGRCGSSWATHGSRRWRRSSTGVTAGPGGRAPPSRPRRTQLPTTSTPARRPARAGRATARCRSAAAAPRTGQPFGNWTSCSSGCARSRRPSTPSRPPRVYAVARLEETWNAVRGRH